MRYQLALFLLLLPIGCFFLVDGSAESQQLQPAGEGLLPTEKLVGDRVWVHAAIQGANPRVVVWFDEQFLGDGKAYVRRARELANWKRRELRTAMVKTLKALSEKSYQAAKPELQKLLAAETISNLERHWIVNGFSCNTTMEGLQSLQKVKGIRAIFAADPVGRGKNPGKAAWFPPGKKTAFDPTRYQHPWYTRYLLADQAWKKYGITGEGTLNVVHDFNFVFSDNLTPNLYRNPREIPGNGKDDDGNGLVDDYHGYNFAAGSANLTLAPVGLDAINPQAMHGFMCAAILCGTGAEGKEYEFGLAPEGTWAGVIAGGRIEAAVEWAIEHNADTYSMSFSRPGLGEYRSHWRKLMEHGSFCGVCFVTGAGNFAQTQKVPIQMRIPEDIPLAVFTGTGIQRDFSRTPFSSMGPVHWDTEHYKDGQVNKPEVCAFNAGLPLLKRNGTVVPVAINGNSFAGPMVAGSIALILSANPDLPPWEVRDILTSTATDVAQKGYDFETGHGLINCYRAVKEALRRKAVRAGKDPRQYEGRDKEDVLDLPAIQKKLKAVFKVLQIQPGSQAAKLGVQKGDIIISYNNEPITTRESMERARKKAANLETIPVVIQRDQQRLTVQFSSRPLGVIPAIEYDEPVFQ